MRLLDTRPSLSLVISAVAECIASNPVGNSYILCLELYIMFRMIDALLSFMNKKVCLFRMIIYKNSEARSVLYHFCVGYNFFYVNLFIVLI